MEIYGSCRTESGISYDTDEATCITACSSGWPKATINNSEVCPNSYIICFG
jgi:hypothetical protein